jgi:hypothetical protein
MRRWLRRILLLALVCYGVYGLWRVFPRFDGRLIGSWNIIDLNTPPADITFFPRGGGRRGNSHGEREFRWWTCGNRLIMHPIHRDRGENIKEAVEYAFRILFFMDPQPNVTEFDIVRLDGSSARFDQRPRLFETGVTDTLVLRR